MNKKIVGYCDPLSMRPGERVRFMVSCEPGVDSYQRDFVRLICGDTAPGSPGTKESPVDWADAGELPARNQPIHPGGRARISMHPDAPCFAPLEGLTVLAMVRPSLPQSREQAAIVSWWAPHESANSKTADDGTGFCLFIEADQGLMLRIGDPAGAGAGGYETFGFGTAMIANEWYFVAATFEGRSGVVQLHQEPLGTHAIDYPPGPVEHQSRLRRVTLPDCDVLIAAAPGTASDAPRSAPFNGRIERPAIARRALPRELMESLRYGEPSADAANELVAGWDFSRDMSSDRIFDLSGAHHHGQLFNLPIRAVRGSNWTGDELDWRHAPAQYAAIHFAEDALHDCAWQVDFELDVPTDAVSGVYAARLRSAEQEDYIPFFVRPPVDGPHKKLAVLFPTASYFAYANARMFEWETGPLSSNSPTVLGAEEVYLIDHPEVGLSTYDWHIDGTGVCYTSRLRPILNMRPKLTGHWGFNADLHLIDWLESQGFDYDVVTDEDLHAEGIAALEPYQCVMTGTHPEYYSTPMWDAMTAYLSSGGRLMYMGGNGFYWRVAFRDDLPGAMEMRRAEDGSRSWIAEPGEYFMSFTGEYGGLWWRAGRTPHSIVGNGFAAQGFDHSSYYRRQPDSFDPRARFIFEGVGDDERIGDFGLVLGGAAGLELDRYDLAFGTPPHALRLASSEDHTGTYLHVNEELGHMYPSISGLDDPNVRADLVFFETGAGGAVFSTGSIAWCGSLFHNQYDNNVSRITGNVLRRFLDSTRFDPAPVSSATRHAEPRGLPHA